MNYFKQLNGYKKQRRIKPLSSNAMLLYFILLEYANELYFPDSFTAANSVLCSLCAFSPATLTRRRKELADKGYIEYTCGERDQCGTYVIIPIEFKNERAYDAKTDNTSETKVTTLNNINNKYKKSNKFNSFSANGKIDYDLDAYEQAQMQKRIGVDAGEG